MTTKETLKLVKNEAKVLGVFLLNLLTWSWQFFAGINLIIMLCAPHTDNLLVFGVNFLFGIFLVKSYMHYSLLEKRFFSLEEDFRDYRRGVSKKFEEVDMIFTSF